MLRRNFLSTLAAPLLASQSKSQRPPNVLFIVADDLNTALGAYGHPLVQTPNIDALARRGVRFDRAYCQNPLCCPSRASFLTGLRPDSSQVWANNVDFRTKHPDLVTLPQHFKNNGYYSAREGKLFHMNVPAGVGTPEFQDPPSWSHSGSPQGLEDKSPGTLHRLGPPEGQAFGITWMSTADAKGQADEDAASRAISLLEAHQNEPFFLGLGFVRPHLPLVAPSRFFDLYPLDRCQPAQNPPNDIDDISPLFRSIIPNLWNHMGMSEAEQREALRGYYATTSFMDEQCGRVLSALDRLNLRDNTIVVFTSDHGWHLGEHTRWQKRSFFEESARVPLIVADPRRPIRGRASAGLVELVDLYPTLCDLTGLPAPAHLEGQSFAPLLSNPRRRWKRAAYTHFQLNGIRGDAVHAPNYHYFRWRAPDGRLEEELYDRRRDPRQFTNQAANPRFARQREQGLVLLNEGWQKARA